MMNVALGGFWSSSSSSSWDCHSLALLAALGKVMEKQRRQMLPSS